jgi:hypothetical protein
MRSIADRSDIIRTLARSKGRFGYRLSFYGKGFRREFGVLALANDDRTKRVWKNAGMPLCRLPRIAKVELRFVRQIGGRFAIGPAGNLG